MPQMRIRALQNDLNPSIGWVTPFDRPVVLLDDVVQVFVLEHQDVNTGISLDTFNSRRVGTAIVNGDFLGQAVLADGALQKAPWYCLVPLGIQ